MRSRSHWRRLWVLAAVLVAIGVRAVAAEEAVTAAYLQDVERIKALQLRYLTLYDLVEGRASERPSTAQIVDELFAADGEWVAVFSDGRQEVHRGREQLIDMLEDVSRRHVNDPGHVVKHHGYNSQVRVHGSRASLKAQFIVLHASGQDSRNVWVAGRYDDELERDDSGTWRFKLKIVHVEDLTFWRSVPAVDR